MSVSVHVINTANGWPKLAFGLHKVLKINHKINIKVVAMIRVIFGHQNDVNLSFITYLFNLTILIQTSKPRNKIICISTCAIRSGTF